YEQEATALVLPGGASGRDAPRRVSTAVRPRNGHNSSLAGTKKGENPGRGPLLWLIPEVGAGCLPAHGEGAGAPGREAVDLRVAGQRRADVVQAFAFDGHDERVADAVAREEPEVDEDRLRAGLPEFDDEADLAGARRRGGAGRGGLCDPGRCRGAGVVRDGVATSRQQHACRDQGRQGGRA